MAFKPHAYVFKFLYMLLFYAVIIWESCQRRLRTWREQNSAVHATMSASDVAAALSSLTKLPSHLAFVFDSRLVFIDEISTVVCWAMACNIPAITLYDREGKLHKFLDSLLTLSRAPNPLFGSL